MAAGTLRWPGFVPASGRILLCRLTVLRTHDTAIVVASLAAMHFLASLFMITA